MVGRRGDGVELAQRAARTARDQQVDPPWSTWASFVVRLKDTMDSTVLASANHARGRRAFRGLGWVGRLFAPTRALWHENFFLSLFFLFFLWFHGVHMEGGDRAPQGIEDDQNTLGRRLPSARGFPESTSRGSSFFTPAQMSIWTARG